MEQTACKHCYVSFCGFLIPTPLPLWEARLPKCEGKNGYDVDHIFNDFLIVLKKNNLVIEYIKVLDTEFLSE